MLKTSRTRGFTLIELLIYIGIASMILTSLIVFLWTVMSVGTKNSIGGNFDTELRYVDQRLASEIKNAIEINFDASDFGVDLAENSNAKISLKEINPRDPTIISVADGVLQITAGGSAPVPLTSNAVKVTSLVFTDYSSDDGLTKQLGYVVSLSTTSSVRQEFSETSTLRSSVELRNR